jgi:ADP-ribose pyrophosphatase YjhB (NUDIX family)
METFLNDIKRIKSIAEIGLLYAKDNYDRERYHELNDISLSMMARLTDTPLSILTNFHVEGRDYPTPKVDIRAFIVNKKDEILLARESVDGCWSLPGGWADIGLTPREVAVKEVFEETGLHVETQQLMAIFDKKCHPHPPQAFYVYKIVFLCTLKNPTQAFNKGFDILDVGYFNVHKLPPLSTHRILDSQIFLLFNQWKNKVLMPYCD